MIASSAGVIIKYFRIIDKVKQIFTEIYKLIMKVLKTKLIKIKILIKWELLTLYNRMKKTFLSYHLLKIVLISKKIEFIICYNNQDSIKYKIRNRFVRMKINYKRKTNLYQKYFLMKNNNRWMKNYNRINLRIKM